MANKILEADLSPEDEALLRESIEAWKTSVYETMLEEVEQLKEKTIAELEEANQEYISEVKKEMTEKMVKALEEMREDMREEIFTEMVTTNPELQILEKIKALVAPTLNEEFSGNVYSEQISALVEENSALKRDIELREGARTLAGLIKDYDSKTQKLILSFIREGSAEEITEQFYSIAEVLELFTEGEDDETGDPKDSIKVKTDKEYEDFTAWKKDNPKPSKDEFDDQDGYKKAVAQWEKDADKAKLKFTGELTGDTEEEDDEEKKEKFEESYAEWLSSEPKRRHFELNEDFEYAHSLWEEDEPKEDDEDEEEPEEDEEDEDLEDKETSKKDDKKKAPSKKVEDDEEEDEDKEEDKEEDEEEDEEEEEEEEEKEEKPKTESVKKKGFGSYINEGTKGARKNQPTQSKPVGRTMRDEINRLANR